eukprot:g6856.t1
MGNTFKLSPSFPQSLILSTSKLKSLIQEVKKDALDMDTAGLESLLSLNEDEATLTILRFAKRKDRPIVSKYHLLSGLIIVSQGSVEEKIACIFKLFDMSDLNEYTHDEFGVAVMLNNESEILRRVEHAEKLPLPVATDPTLPISDPQAQEFLDKLSSVTSPDFSLDQMRRLIAEGRALAAAICPHNKL